MQLRNQFCFVQYGVTDCFKVTALKPNARYRTLDKRTDKASQTGASSPALLISEQLATDIKAPINIQAF